MFSETVTAEYSASVVYIIILAIGFVIVTKKCFFDKYSFSRAVVPALLSPIMPCMIALMTTMDMWYSPDMKEVVGGHILYAAIILGIMAVQLPLYIVFVKPKNRSAAVFLYLCCLVSLILIFLVRLAESKLMPCEEKRK